MGARPVPADPPARVSEVGQDEHPVQPATVGPVQTGRRGKLVLERYNFVAPLEEAGEPVTTRPDAPAAPE